MTPEASPPYIFTPQNIGVTTFTNLDGMMILTHKIGDFLKDMYPGGEEAAYFVDSSTLTIRENPNSWDFVEVFIMTHTLREYRGTPPYGRARFELFRDNDDADIREPFAYFEELYQAITCLLVVDMQTRCQVLLARHFSNLLPTTH